MELVADGVYRLGTGSHNFYVVTDGDEATVIDGGCSREWPKLIAGLDSIGLSLDSVSALVATHAHADHFGIAKRASDEGIEVRVHEGEETRAIGTYEGRFAVTPTELPILSLRTWRNFFPLIMAGIMRMDHLERVGTFRDGDRLDVAGNPVSVHTPGHTEGHTMFHCPQVGVLFTGDGMATMNIIGNSVGPQMMDDRFHQNPDQARASLSRIEGLDADLLLPGHGRPWSGSPSAALIMIAD